MLATDSPLLTFEMLELFEGAGLQRLVGDYLGEPPLLSVHKTTLRKADPAVGGAWHQDGAFMGDVRALNLWLSLSRCGDEAPGLDVVPRRLDEVVIEHGAMLDVELTRAKAREAAGDTGILRPIFEPGDALFFDELFLHQTASDPVDAEPALRDRELVLRRLRVPARLRADRGLGRLVDQQDQRHEPRVRALLDAAVAGRQRRDGLVDQRRPVGERHEQPPPVRGRDRALDHVLGRRGGREDPERVVLDLVAAERRSAGAAARARRRAHPARRRG